MDQVAQMVQTDLETAVRKTTLQFFTNIVLRSPVGNPELWAANAETIYRRETHNIFVDAFNADTQSNKANYNPRTGKLKGSARFAKTRSARALAKAFPLAAGRGYVGGRFRANWNASYMVPNLTTTESTDKTRGAEEAQRSETFPVGGIIYLSNGLPYAERLEFGWSKQAPAGMIRRSVQEFDGYMRKALA